MWYIYGWSDFLFDWVFQSMTYHITCLFTFSLLKKNIKQSIILFIQPPPYVCCPDGVSIARGPDQEWCTCKDWKFTCWPHRSTSASVRFLHHFMFSLSIIFCRALTLIGCVCAAVAAPELSPGETTTENSGCIKISCKIVDGKVFFWQWKKANIIYLITPGSDCKGVWGLPRNSPDCGEENIKLEQTGCCKICISCKDHSNNVRKVGETWNNRKWVETTGWMEDKCKDGETYIETSNTQCSQASDCSPVNIKSLSIFIITTWYP